MRRLLVIVAFLSRLAGQSYVWTVRPVTRPAPIERPLETDASPTRNPWWLP